MPVIKSASTFDGTAWGEAVPFGADSINITMTNVAALPTTDTSIVLTNTDTAMQNSETLTTAANKYNRLKQRIINKFNAIDATLNKLNSFTTLSVITALNTSATDKQLYSAKIIQTYLKNVIGITGSSSANIVTVNGTNQTTVKNALTALNSLINTVNGKLANYIPKAGHNNALSGWEYDVTYADADAYRNFFRFFQPSRNMLNNYKVTHAKGKTPSNPQVGYAFAWYAKRKKSSSDSTLVNQRFAQISGRVYYPTNTLASDGLSTTFKQPRSEIVLTSTCYDLANAKEGSNWMILGCYQDRSAYVGLSHPSTWRQALKIKSGSVKVPKNSTSGVKVKFGTAFSSTPAVVCTCQAVATNHQDTYSATVSGISASEFTVKVHHIKNATTNATPGSNAFVRDSEIDVTVEWIAMEKNT